MDLFHHGRRPSIGFSIEIESEIIRFYKQLYMGETWNRPRPDGVVINQVDSHKALLIEVSFSEEEIKEAVFWLGEDSPRP